MQDGAVRAQPATVTAVLTVSCAAVTWLLAGAIALAVFVLNAAEDDIGTADGFGYSMLIIMVGLVAWGTGACTAVLLVVHRALGRTFRARTWVFVLPAAVLPLVVTLLLDRP